MSSSSVGNGELFLPTVPDEESELRALAHALSFAEKFSLLFVRCNQPVQRQRLMAAVQKQLPQVVIQQIHLREPVSHLLDEIRQQMTDPAPNAIFVSGLEYSLLSIEHAPASPFVANLNVARDLFARDIHCPLVLWVPEYILSAIMHGAPDFFSIRSGVFYFLLAPSEAVLLSRSLLEGTIWETRNLSVEEKRERIRAIEEILSDYQNFPSSRRDHRTVAQLLNRLGALFLDFGNYDEAEKKFHNSLELWQALGNRSGVANSYHYLGLVAHARRAYAEALAWYRQALAINTALGNGVGIAASYHQMGRVAQEDGVYDEALEWYRKALALAEEERDRVVIASSCHNLGFVAQERGAYDEALEWYHKALAINEELGERGEIASLYHELGFIAQKRRAYDEALQWYLKSLAINEELGDHEGIANSYHQLGIMAWERGAYDEALEWSRKALTVREEIGDRKGRASSYGQLAALLTERGEVHEAARLNLKSLSLHTELQSPNVNFNLRLLQRQREQLGEEQFLAVLRKHGDEKTVQELLELLTQNHNK